MNIASVVGIVANVLSALPEKEQSVSQEYKALVERLFPAEEYRTRDEVNASDDELSQFRENLIAKGSALFLKELNEEKIEALVEEYRQKLLEEQAANPDKPMDINQMVSDFKKELLEKLMETQKMDRENTQTQTASLMSGDLLQKIKSVREKTSTQMETGFLEQLLNALPIAQTEQARRIS